MTDKKVAELYRDWKRAEREKGTQHPVTWEVARQYFAAKDELAKQQKRYK